MQVPFDTAEKIDNSKLIAVIGNNSLTYSIAMCFINAGYCVNLCTDDIKEAENTIVAYLSEAVNKNGELLAKHRQLIISESLKDIGRPALAIVITEENLASKIDTIQQLEKILQRGAVIGINTESIGLSDIQEGAMQAERIIGLNWTEPAHTTLFFEIITNDTVDKKVEELSKRLALTLIKDAYVVQNLGVRSRLLSALIREAFYLVENGYASVEDIDRACRNDAGYYLPFAGNCRYMDLMGTYAYGMVMKDLNPELSKEQELPAFFKKIIDGGGAGMENKKGFYQYSAEEVKSWKSIFNQFSYQIEAIINKYPFNYKSKNTA